MDVTNVGISPYVTSPVTVDTAAYTTGVDTTAYTTGVDPYGTGVVYDQGLAVPGATTTVVQDAGLGLTTTYADPYATAYTTTDPYTTYQTDPLLLASGTAGSALPPVTSPEIVSQNPLAQTTGSYIASNTGLEAYGTSQPTGYGTATLGTPVTEVAPVTQVTQVTEAIPTPVSVATPVPVAQPVPVAPPVPATPPVGPIMDEDFQRGRPIYDEFSEDRYRGFRFGV